MNHLIKIFLLNLIFLLKLLTFITTKHAVALKCSYNMLYRTLKPNQINKILFIAEPKWTKFNRYIHQYLKGPSSYKPIIQGTNKSIYTPPSVYDKKNFYTPDEIGSFLTLCAAIDGDSSSLGLLKRISSSELANKAFKTGLFKQRLLKLLNSANNSVDSRLLLSSIVNNNNNNPSEGNSILLSKHGDFLNKVLDSIGEIDVSSDLADYSFGSVSIGSTGAISGLSSSVGKYSKNYIWIPYLNFTSIINSNNIDYIQSVIKSHLLDNICDFNKLPEFEMGFGSVFTDDSTNESNSREKAANEATNDKSLTSTKASNVINNLDIPKSIGLLCLEERVSDSGSGWYGRLLEYFGMGVRRHEYSIVANYALDSGIPLSLSLKHVIMDRLWHNVKHLPEQSQYSVKELYAMYKEGYTEECNNFWWSDPELCLRHLLRIPIGHSKLERSLLIDMLLERVKHLPSDLFQDLTEYFTSCIKTTEYYKYDEIVNKNGFEPVIGRMEYDFESLKDSNGNTDPAYDILKNSYKNQLFVKDVDINFIKGISNSMYKSGIYTNRVSRDGLRILALDGGGVRVLVPLLILKMLLKEMGDPPLYEIFDIFGATSSGSLILSLLLFHKFTIDETMTLFKTMFTKIFSKNKWTIMPDVLRYITSRAKFDHQILEAVGKMIFGNLKMHEFNVDPRTPHIFFTSTQTMPWPPRPVIFRSYPIKPNYDMNTGSNLQDVKYFDIWEVLRSSTAAPTYFEQFTKDGKSYSDGAILSNNPTLEAINEAKMLYPNIPIKCAVSIGTGIFKCFDNDKSIEAQKDRSGASGLVDLLTYATTNVEHVHRYSKMILGSDRYFRLDPSIPEISLDETNATAIEELVKSIQEYLNDNNTKNTIKNITKLLI